MSAHRGDRLLGTTTSMRRMRRMPRVCTAGAVEIDTFIIPTTHAGGRTGTWMYMCRCLVSGAICLEAGSIVARERA